MTDKRTVHIVVTFLGLVVLLGVIGLMILTYLEVDPVTLTPLSQLVAGALGALSALLVSTRSNTDPTLPDATQPPAPLPSLTPPPYAPFEGEV